MTVHIEDAEAKGSTDTFLLRARRLGIHAADQAIVFMRADCPVCRSEGLTGLSRVLLKTGGRSLVATLYQVTTDLLRIDQAGLSEAAWARLGVSEDAPIVVKHADPVVSFSAVRARIFGERFNRSRSRLVVNDIVAGSYSDIELSAFLASSSALPLDGSETVALTEAMVNAGQHLKWRTSPILDKHSVGGLPGNRTTPIVVAIVSAFGLTIPKTSSRAITSPAGTADTMETLAPVTLDIPAIRKVVDHEQGCVVWGGAVQLSPADDILIRVERVLDLDSEGQLVASVLSKKIAAGATHLAIDMPVGPTAKVRSDAAADGLSRRLLEVSGVFGIHAAIIRSDGLQPVGRGIGPSLEAKDILAVLRGRPDAPNDLRQRACLLAGGLLELAGAVPSGGGQAIAEATIASGAAWAKFQRICEAQGGMRVPPDSAHRRPILANRSGSVRGIDNRRVAKVAKLAGAPNAKAAGVEMHVRLGDVVTAGEPLLTVHAESRGELDYALEYAKGQTLLDLVSND